MGHVSSTNQTFQVHSSFNQELAIGIPVTNLNSSFKEHSLMKTSADGTLH